MSYVQGHLARDSQARAAPPLHVNDKLGVGVGESSKLVLVQVHDEEFVRGRQLHRLPGELLVEVGSVALVLLDGSRVPRDEGRAEWPWLCSGSLWERWPQAPAGF